MTPRVYLADLRHTYMGVLSSDTMPLNVGYMKAVMDRDLPEVRSTLFVYPDRLLEAMRRDPPDVLMLSNYMWCEKLSLHMARTMKQIRPETLVVLGGPNIFDEPDRQLEYVDSRPEIDLYVLGEGDFLATEIVRAHLDSGLDKARLFARDLDSSVYRRPDGSMVRHEVRRRGRNIDDIPSPWLTGVMDAFFDGKLSPLWETNRGCPFQCTFCVQGTGYYNRVSYFDQARLREEIDYMGRMIRERSPAIGMLRIADPNYGMYGRDPEISGYIGEAQRRYGWPRYIDATTGKNRPDRIIESLEKVSGAMVLWQAVQSLDENVLRNVQRENIKLEAYEALQIHLRGRGLKSSSDLILGLPGESLDSHVAGMMRMIDAGIMKLNNFQCMMLKGTKLEGEQARREYGFETRHRVICKSIGRYEGTPVFEIDEIVVATDTLSFEDYLEARTYHLGCGVFLNHTRLEPLFEFGTRLGLQRSTLVRALIEALKAEAGPLRRLLDEFLEETRSELFEDPDALQQFYSRPENFERLVRGEIGDNLISKYSSKIFFSDWAYACGFALDVARGILLESGVRERMPEFDDFWADFRKMLVNKYAAGSTRAEFLDPVEAELRYDMGRWLAEGMNLDPRPYRLDAPALAVFRLDAERADEIAAAIDTWTLSPQGQTMLLKRVRVGGFERDLEIPVLTAA
jgi:radical SAM superfamily enzyme YgiQ (UPF0313 family)